MPPSGVLPSGALAQALVARRYDRVFNVLHGQHGGGEDGVVQGLIRLAVGLEHPADIQADLARGLDDCDNY